MRAELPHTSSRRPDPDNVGGFAHIGDVVAGFMVLLCWRILRNPKASTATKAQARAWLLDHPEAGQHAKLPPRGDSR